MIGWKQAYSLNRWNLVLVKLYVHDESVTIPRKKGYLIAKEATVMEITSLDGLHHVSEAVSMKDGQFRYQVGNIVKPMIDRSIGDAPGIYFFDNKQKAIDYVF